MRAATLFIAAAASVSAALADWRPGDRSMLSAHNCYPYHGRWTDRIDRALSSGLPLAIEQDLCWIEHPETGEMTSIVSHGAPFDGQEPTLREHFFERVRPIVEGSLEQARTDPAVRAAWPIIVLDLDIKHNNEAHVRAIAELLREYLPWLSTAPRAQDPKIKAPIAWGPVLVTLSGNGPQQAVFHDEVSTGQPILAFGAAQTSGPDTTGMTAEERAVAVATQPPEGLVGQPATNFRRWWNNPWSVVEAGGPSNAGRWEPYEAQRLRDLVAHAHHMGYWIRFYALNGHGLLGSAVGGWNPGYNVGSLPEARKRWRSCVNAGVDLIATDQYEQFAATAP